MNEVIKIKQRRMFTIISNVYNTLNAAVDVLDSMSGIRNRASTIRVVGDLSLTSSQRTRCDGY